MKVFGPTEKATYLERPNRFTLFCRLNGKRVKAFLPNPGRLRELLLPGALVYLERSLQQKERMPYTAVAIQRDGHPVMVHTHRTNDLVESLLRNELVPGLNGVEILKREYTHGRSRFDFLLRMGGKLVVLEVKSCTLFGQKVAMFPDAITARGKRHVEELVELSKQGISGAVLFLICWRKAEFFMPEYHTDLEFSQTLLSAKERIAGVPIAVEMGEDLSLGSRVRTLEVPWALVEKEAEDRGSYLLILKLPKRKTIENGKLGKERFPAGYYL